MFSPIIALLSGFVLGLIIHAVLWLRMERIHGAELSQEYKDGKSAGYNQCHGEMVVPMQRIVERATGHSIDWKPLRSAALTKPLIQPKRALVAVIVSHRNEEPKLVFAD